MNKNYQLIFEDDVGYLKNINTHKKYRIEKNSYKILMKKFGIKQILTTKIFFFSEEFQISLNGEEITIKF